MLSRRTRIRNIVILVVIALFFGYRLCFPGRSFDSELWQQNKLQLGSKVRLGMADRIVARHMLRGMTSSQVTDMLGKPPATEYFRDWDLVYWLGPERGFLSIDSEWLVVKLDQNEVVADFKIVRD